MCLLAALEHVTGGDPKLQTYLVVLLVADRVPRAPFGGTARLAVEARALAVIGPVDIEDHAEWDLYRLDVVGGGRVVCAALLEHA